MPATRTLVITNDFPPRPGGIQAFVHGLVSRRPPDSVVVYAPSWSGAPSFDTALPFPVFRHPGTTMLPEPTVLRTARDIAHREGCTSVLYGAAAPLALLTPGLRRAGLQRFVALTHGHEPGWAVLPAARQVLRRIGDEVDVLTYLGDYTRQRLARALSPGAARRLARLPPGVDATRFTPEVGGTCLRAQLGLSGRPVVVCVSRLVPRKGQDVLVRCWPQVLRRVPEAALLLVGPGPDRRRLERLARAANVRAAVTFTGAVPEADLPAYYDAGDVFALPCRSRLCGLDTEGLGLAYLEAAATGLPVVAGNVGGAPEALRDRETGYVADGRSAGCVAEALLTLLQDPDQAQAMGQRGRSWVQRAWRWDVAAARLQELLESPAPAGEAYR